ncbi:MAG TPA: adenylosuccinate lyase [Bacteroidales bacterium]|nr:adenylosuccinate lyase [Bacteroidales bacterium]
MNEHSLYAISPIDGRYRKQTGILAAWFSEAALIRFRIMVEIEYFIALHQAGIPQLKGFNPEHFNSLRNIYEHFSSEEAMRVKEIEQSTNHDVKAVENYLRERFDQNGWQEFKEFIHFGLTSQDINNTAQPYALKSAHESVVFPLIDETLSLLKHRSEEWDDIPMLARTHGQPASPTRLGKEFNVFTERLENQILMLNQTPFAAKFGGATGNFNAHYAAFPHFEWHIFADRLIEEKFGLIRLKTTTQIEHYDYLAAYFDNLKRINTILIDLCRDVWSYISLEYFRQRINEKEVGSSAMPHKVNPIDFENAEGNLGVANSFFEHLSAKLPISRMQRDLTDSTVMRNVGVPLAHMVIGLKSIQTGLKKLIINRKAIDRDLERNWAVIAEAIQTILRREGVPNAYELLRQLTRTGEQVTRETLNDFIETLPVDAAVKAELLTITPFNYTGKRNTITSGTEV